METQHGCDQRIRIRNGELNGSPDAGNCRDQKRLAPLRREACARRRQLPRAGRPVVGLVGENGAGKTTLIKHILGLLKAQTGSVRVFGLDPVADPVGVLSRIGYLSEEPDMPGWMRVRELMRYVAAFYPTWDDDYAERLAARIRSRPGRESEAAFERPAGPRRPAGRARLPAASCLLLDEPSSGLDPIVRRDILGAIIRTIADEGRTVLFSSHLLAEVERVSDQVAMIKSGRILFCDSLDRIKQAHARLDAAI